MAMKGGGNDVAVRQQGFLSKPCKHPDRNPVDRQVCHGSYAFDAGGIET